MEGKKVRIVTETIVPEHEVSSLPYLVGRISGLIRVCELPVVLVESQVEGEDTKVWEKDGAKLRDN